MRVLVACEFSGIVRDAFLAKGHDAWSCDLLPCERDGRRHFIDDVRNVLNMNWDLMIAHPPCTYLCSSGLHWNNRVPGRAALTEQALEFVKYLMEQAIPRICVENPVGCISSRIRPPDQYIQPYQFGHDASKNTGLWLKNLPLLTATKWIAPWYAGGNTARNARWGNQTKSGQNRLGPSPTRAADRSRTYQGIADAMAAQWGSHAPATDLHAFVSSQIEMAPEIAHAVEEGFGEMYGVL